MLLDEPSQLDVRLHLFDLEQAVARLIALVAAGNVADRHWDRLQVAAERLRRGRSGRRGVPPRAESDPMRQTLGALISASVALQSAADRALTAAAVPVPSTPPPGPLAWRGATSR